MLRVSILIELLKKFLTAIADENHKFESSNSAKANKTDKIWAKSKNIKKLSKIKRFAKANLEQFTFSSSKTSNILLIRYYSD